MLVVQNRKTKEYHGYCTTTGGCLWIDDVNNRMVAKYDNKRHLDADLNWVPWHWWLTKWKIVEI